jgi:hypothetical protein
MNWKGGFIQLHKNTRFTKQQHTGTSMELHPDIRKVKLNRVGFELHPNFKRPEPAEKKINEAELQESRRGLEVYNNILKQKERFK